MRPAIITTLIAVVALWSAAVPADRSYNDFFDQTFGDFPAELERAREEGKEGILLYFHMDVCPFCQRMEANVLNQAEVQDYFREHFLTFMVDVEGGLDVIGFDGEEMAEHEFALKHRARATPVFAFFDLEGEPMARFTGATNGPEEFLLLGEYVVEGHYEDQPFAKYRRERGGR